jgi:nitroreductase
MEFLQKLNWRYATKGFDPAKKLSAEQIEGLLEALRLAPSSFGLQPWKFVLVENPELRATLRGASWNQAQITEASHLIVLCRQEHMGPQEIEHFVETTAKERGQDAAELEGYKKMMEGAMSAKDEEKRAVWASEQVYLALGVLLSACAAADIDSCPMEGFDAAQYDEILDLPGKGLHAVVVCPVGFRSADDKYAMAKKVRYSKEELIVRL